MESVIQILWIRKKIGLFIWIRKKVGLNIWIRNFFRLDETSNYPCSNKPCQTCNYYFLFIGKTPTDYRLGKVNSNMVNSKFQLIQINPNVFPILKCNVNSNCIYFEGKSCRWMIYYLWFMSVYSRVEKHREQFRSMSRYFSFSFFRSEIPWFHLITWAKIYQELKKNQICQGILVFPFFDQKFPDFI